MARRIAYASVYRKDSPFRRPGDRAQHQDVAPVVVIPVTNRQDTGGAHLRVGTQERSGNIRYPSLYQINARVWLRRLSRQEGKTATLKEVPDDELDRIASLRLGLA